MVWFPLVAGIVALGVFLVWRQWFQTYHLGTVHPGVLYRDGNRGLREFANAVRRVRPRTVVCLIDDNELSDARKPQFQQELRFLEQQAIPVQRIPIPLGGWPTPQQLRLFLSIVSDTKNQPVLVHCAQGVRRTGMLVAAYQQSVLGYDDARAKAAILTFGHSRRSIGDVEKFIELYDPKQMEMMQSLPMSVE